MGLCRTLLVAIALFGLAFAAQATAASAPPPIAISGPNINQLERYAPALTTLLSRSQNYAIGNPAGTQVAAPSSTAIPTLIYRSLARFQSDVSGKRIDSRVKAIVYDPEYWADTPLSEQQHPITATKQFAALAHQHGYRFIAAPGRDLLLTPGGACTKQVGETLDQAYLRCQIPSKVALVSDGVVIQTQADEADPPRMYSLMAGAASQARSANPTVQVFGTVSSESPSGAEVTDQTMITAFATIAPLVDAYWVNVFPSQPGDLQISATALATL
jgi:hypothetical protein